MFGRAFRLANPSQNGLGAPSNGPGTAGTVNFYFKTEYWTQTKFDRWLALKLYLKIYLIFVLKYRTYFLNILK